jgi:hypothetical protein
MRWFDHYARLHIQNSPPVYVAGRDESDLREKFDLFG